MTNPIEMQDVTPTHQTVYAIALRITGQQWYTAGMFTSDEPDKMLAWWRCQGYEARLLTAQMPTETKP